MSKSCENLKNYLPAFLTKDKTFKNLLQSIGREFDDLDLNREDLEKQIFLRSCDSFGIRYWEDLCNIEVNEDIDLDTRKAKILSKLTHIPPITINYLKKVVANFLKDSDVVQYPEKYSFKILLKDIDNIKDLKALIDNMEEIKPAHLYFFLAFLIRGINDEKFTLKSTNRFSINFFQNRSLFLDGSWVIDGENLINGYKDYFDPITLRIVNSFFISKNNVFKPKVIIKKDLWYLDGKNNLDGEKLLDSEILEEVL